VTRLIIFLLGVLLGLCMGKDLNVMAWEVLEEQARSFDSGSDWRGEMPRNMSFAMTTEQVRAKTKTVTRRFGWWFLMPGDVVCAVEKAMGLKRGEKIERLALIRIVSTRAEALSEITQEDVIKEGFPDWSPDQFIQMLAHHYGVLHSSVVNRIEFEYLDDY